MSPRSWRKHRKRNIFIIRLLSRVFSGTKRRKKKFWTKAKWWFDKIFKQDSNVLSTSSDDGGGDAGHRHVLCVPAYNDEMANDANKIILIPVW